jgi:hypothetical protein
MKVEALSGVAVHLCVEETLNAEVASVICEAHASTTSEFLNCTGTLFFALFSYTYARNHTVFT